MVVHLYNHAFFTIMSRYKHLFFDLDNTLWDFERNSQEALCDLFRMYRLYRYFTDAQNFIETYRKKNAELWSDYRNRKITREQLNIDRFYLILSDKMTDEQAREMSVKLAKSYVDVSQTKNHLIPNAYETIKELSERYNLYIVTNGFVVFQERKLRNSGFSEFVKKVYYSEEIGYIKPEKEYFDAVLKDSGAEPFNSLVIGDHFDVDIYGAKMSGIDQVYYNPNHQEDKSFQPTFEITNLSELLDFL